MWGPRGGFALVTSVILASTLLHAVLVAHPRYALPLIGVLAAGGASGLSAARARLAERRNGRAGTVPARP
jgi:hypothetical protein